MAATVTPCAVCCKPTAAECSHVDCPNRRRLTAQLVGSISLTRGESVGGAPVTGYAVVRRPHLFED